MTSAIVNHLWQSTVVVLAAAVVARALSRHQARVRHAVWLAASLKFLVPFSLLIAIGGALSWRAAPPATGSTPAFVETLQTITEPFSDRALESAPAVEVRTPTPMPWPIVLAVLWGCGVVVILAMRVRGWVTVRAALRASTPATLPGVGGDLRVRVTTGLLEPGVVGVWRPVLLVPAGLETLLTDDQLHAVVAHELHHVRRRDNLTSLCHMAVETAFWFHPLVWWISARLVDERERACDEHVVASGTPPDAYAEAILSVCKRYVEAPVACVAGVTGSDLKSRLNAILAGRVGADLSASRKTAVVFAALVALIVPVAAGVITAPLRVIPQAASGPVPKFEVVSVRPCDPAAPGPGRGNALANASPGRLNYGCGSLLELIRAAYVIYSNGRVQSRMQQPIMPGPGAGPTTRDRYPWPSGLPEWIWRDRFAIEAKAEGEPPLPVLFGPMLQSLLEDKFHLKVHRETREAPTYELVVAKSGSKLKPAVAGSCVPYDFSVSPQPAPPAGQHRCDNHNQRDADGNYVYTAEMTTIDEFFAGWGTLGRPLVNKTGITGYVAVHFVQPTHTPGAEEATAALIAALKDQLGLELRPATDPMDFLVIDHAEKPDFADAGASASSRPAPAPSQKFDVVSIRQCDPATMVAGRPGGRGTGAGAPGAADDQSSSSPGRLYLHCETAALLVRLAYFGLRSQNAPIAGGPAWLNDDRFDVEAIGPSGVDESTMQGPMLRALLEVRFRLETHRERRTRPVYALRTAKSGFKLMPLSASTCAPVPGVPPGRARCGTSSMMYRPDGRSLELKGSTVATYADFLERYVPFDRPVIDETGIPGLFDFHLNLRTDGSADQMAAAALAPQLGLTLDNASAPADFLVIDHIEKPAFVEAGVSDRSARPRVDSASKASGSIPK